MKKRATLFFQFRFVLAQKTELTRKKNEVIDSTNKKAFSLKMLGKTLLT